MYTKLSTHSAISYLLYKFYLNRTEETANLMTESKCRHSQRKFLSTQDKDIQKARELHHQNILKWREQLKRLSDLNSEYAKTLDMKECMLEVQRILMRKLTAEENHHKELTVLLNFSVKDFEKQLKKIVEMIQTLQYWEQTMFAYEILQENVSLLTVCFIRESEHQKSN